MKRKLLTILTTLALCLGLLPGTALAAGTPTRTGTLNLAELTASTDKTEEEGWKWEITGSSSGTLTLTNCYIQADTKDVIIFPAYFTLTTVLVGDNTLETSASLGGLDPMVHGINEKGSAIENGVCQIIRGEGTLQIKGAGTGYGFGGEDLTVQSGTIASNIGFCKITNKFTMSGGSVTASGSDYGLYLVKGPVDISGGKLDLAGAYCGIFVSGQGLKNATSVNISGGTVKAIGGLSAGIYVRPHEDSYNPDTSPQAINVTGGNLTVEGGLRARDINIAGGSVTGNGGQIGIYAAERVSVSGSQTYVDWQGAGSLDISGGTETTITGGVVKVDNISEGIVKENVILFAGADGQVYGSASLAQNLTIPAGSTLTIPEGASLSFRQGAVLTNEGTVQIKNGDAITDIPAYIRNLNLAGNGTVVVEKNSGGSTVEETYTNEGKRLLASAGELDLSGVTSSDNTNWSTQGYKWDVLEKDPISGAVTQGKLTLAPGFNAKKVILPDAEVTIETESEGDSSIGTLVIGGGSPQKTNLIFSGPGTLTIQESLNISGNNKLRLTVEEGASVVANNGISIGASGAVDGTVTVNGNLTVKQGNGVSAIYTGRVDIGDKGVLEVSGECGVSLSGMTTEDGSPTFSNLFTVTGEGRFTADCSEYNVAVGTSGSFPEGTTAKDAIKLAPEYMPDDCDVRINEDGTQIDLIRISTDKVYSGALTIHKNHVWDTAWTDGGEDTHYHACIYKGCTEKNSITPHYYAHGATACRDCGHARPEGAPDSDPGDPSNPSNPSNPNNPGNPGNSGGSSSGGGSSGGTSSSSGSGSGDGGIYYAITVEKSEHGGVISSHTRASKGSAVTLTVTPDSGYQLDGLTVTDRQGDEVKLVEKNGKYTFTMPDRAVTVRARFVSVRAEWSNPYTDVAENAWYYEAVRFVSENGLMSGYGNGLFGPENLLTRAQFVQILYNKEGRPAVMGGQIFSDVTPGSWCADAVAWAAERGITGGYSDGRFRPNESIIREQLAVMLWRYAGSPASDQELPFRDTDQAGGYALEALRWAVENGVMRGKSDGVLDPKGLATRAQTAQMLMNFWKS